MTEPSFSILSTAVSQEEEPVERSLRPDSLAAYIGQPDIKETLTIAIQAARERGGSVDHVLLYGPPGLGKTSLANVIAKEMGSAMRGTSGPAISKGGDLASILTSLQDGDVLFIDEIHRLPTAVEELLYSAMEDRCLDIMLGKGPSARSIRLDLPGFTLIGATTRAGSLSHPLRERFGLIHRLDYYNDEDLVTILKRSSSLLSIEITDEALHYLATRSRKTPRVANRLLKRVRDFATVKGRTLVDVRDVSDTLVSLDIDHMGLDKADRMILSTIYGQFKGGPVGLETLAATTGEATETIEDVIEPYLLQIGFIERTPRGRVLSDIAKQHIAS